MGRTEAEVVILPDPQASVKAEIQDSNSCLSDLESCTGVPRGSLDGQGSALLVGDKHKVPQKEGWRVEGENFGPALPRWT